MFAGYCYFVVVVVFSEHFLFVEFINLVFDAVGSSSTKVLYAYGITAR